MNPLDEKFQFHINSPLVKSHELTQRNKKAGLDTDIYLKLDSCQASGSFKLRGLGHFILKHYRQQKLDSVVSSSGGNAGLAAAYSAFNLNLKSTIVVPKSANPVVIEKLKSFNANVIVHGNVWAEADVLARQIVEETKALYVPPFDHPIIWEGNSTMVDEIEAQLNQHVADGNNNLVIPDCIIGSVGGGGMLLGLIEGIRQRGWFEKKKDLKIVAVETIGADCFYQSVQQGKLVTLDAITSIAKTLGASVCAKQLFDYYLQYKDNIISLALPDADSVDGCLKFLDHHKIFVEPSCGVSLAVAYDLKKHLPDHQFKNVVVIVCGGATLDLADLLKFKQQFNL